MTGIVLALAGLTCADAGPGVGVAREPVALTSLEEQSHRDLYDLRVAVCRLERDGDAVRMTYSFQWTWEVRCFCFLRRFGSLYLSYWDAHGKRVECRPGSGGRRVMYNLDERFAFGRKRRFERGRIVHAAGRRQTRGLRTRRVGLVTKPVPLPE